MTRRAAPLAVALVLVLVTAACDRPAGTRGRSAPPGPGCLPEAYRTGPATPAAVASGTVAPGTAATGTGEPAGTGSVPLADLTLPCLDGGAPVRLAGLAGPMVVNLWASWCPPCRAELPALQSYADRAAGRVRMLGVATNNPGAGPSALVDDLRLTFPMLRDDRGALLREVGRTALPVTLLVDARGRVVYVYNATALTEARLDGLVTRYLGVSAG